MTRTLQEVQDEDGCRWPVSTNPKLFCGKPRANSHLPFLADPAPYCRTHLRIATGARSGATT